MNSWYSLTTRRCYEKKTGWLLVLVIAALFLAACQANYIRDVQGGTVAPSSLSELTGLAVQ
ncbi:colicin release lysis protein [Salmonella enterica]|uniref:colicin release lysis protein n=1 Tax=Salmonella enterica TaxID=28901 RepID=UPI0009AC35E3|nr:colicin release lysis protein [Salmonella enterica]EAA8036347.1 lysis protein for colicin E6 [Salmonella enterica subsp. enterica serovar Duisburg]EDV3147626.1 lysis protein for colicin E6 [Salmonella enterica subsp. enterica serovar Chandans]EHT5516462.1 colicin release lysis protein [Salmonella enterica subsp. enterica serovar Sandiego]EAP0829620.1 lysis protein for colicin E6 [Salmonella enterica]EAQ9952531.1 lysis protein for colicin E6 [Salmonella enterica]